MSLLPAGYVPPPIIEPGRNVWSRRGGGPFYQLGSGLPRLADAGDFWTLAYGLGVVAIKRRINDYGYTDPNGHQLDLTNAWVGPGTDVAIKWLQRRLGFTGAAVDGVVGPATARAMWAPLVQQYEVGHSLPRGLLRASMDLESSWDPGAQGDSTPYDLGLRQINTKVYPTPLLSAYDPTWAVHTWAVEEQNAWAFFVPDPAVGRQPWQTDSLRLQCTAGAHYAPGWAASWWRTGRVPVPPNGQVGVDVYARAVLARIPKFT